MIRAGAPIPRELGVNLQIDVMNPGGAVLRIIPVHDDDVLVQLTQDFRLFVEDEVAPHDPLFPEGFRYAVERV